jgi:hypothetical protein
MALSNETVSELLIQVFGTDFGTEEVEHLRPLLERQMERMRELQALDLGGDDPRTMFYITDRRLSPAPGLGGAVVGEASHE